MGVLLYNLLEGEDDKISEGNSSRLYFRYRRIIYTPITFENLLNLLLL